MYRVSQRNIQLISWRRHMHTVRFGYRCYDAGRDVVRVRRRHGRDPVRPMQCWVIRIRHRVCGLYVLRGGNICIRHRFCELHTSASGDVRRLGGRNERNCLCSGNLLWDCRRAELNDLRHGSSREFLCSRGICCSQVRCWHVQRGWRECLHRSACGLLCGGGWHERHGVRTWQLRGCGWEERLSCVQPWEQSVRRRGNFVCASGKGVLCSGAGCDSERGLPCWVDERRLWLVELLTVRTRF